MAPPEYRDAKVNFAELYERGLAMIGTLDPRDARDAAPPQTESRPANGNHDCRNEGFHGDPEQFFSSSELDDDGLKHAHELRNARMENGAP